jgi:hypothetical protein
MTPRGVRLFTREAIEQLARQREDRAPKGLRVRAPDVQRFLAERVVQPSSSGE